MSLTEIQKNVFIVTVLLAFSYVSPSNGFDLGDLVKCSLCHPFAGESAPKECETDPEFGVQCPLCYRLTGPDGLISETCVPINNYMSMMNAVIQPELDLCWLKNQGNCILRLVGPISSSSPTMSPLQASTEAGTHENCVEDGSEANPSTAEANPSTGETDQSSAAEDNITEDSAEEDEDVVDNVIDGDDAVVDGDEEDKGDSETLDDSVEDKDTADGETSEEDDTVLFQEIFDLFIDDDEQASESTIEQ